MKEKEEQQQTKNETEKNERNENFTSIKAAEWELRSTNVLFFLLGFSDLSNGERQYRAAATQQINCADYNVTLLWYIKSL